MAGYMKLPRELNGKLAELTHGDHTVEQFLQACKAINDDKLNGAIEGIWCGREGRMTDIYDDQHNLTVGWYNNIVEYAYVS